MISRRRFGLGATAAILALGASGCSTVSADDGPVTSSIATGAALAPVNALRAARGLPPLVADATLSAAAREHAEAMVRRGRVSHAGFRGRMRRAGVVFPAAENVAMGQPNTEAVVAAWEQSRGHRRNMLGNYKRLGVARAQRPGGRPFWAMVLAN